MQLPLPRCQCLLRPPPKPHTPQAFTSTDEQLLQQCARSNWTDGATCVAVWLVGSTALVANIGDAKCVLARRAQQDSSQAGGKVGERVFWVHTR